MVSLFRNNQYDRCHNFDISRFNLLLETLMIRDGVIGLQLFTSDEIEAIIDDICTNWRMGHLLLFIVDNLLYNIVLSTNR